MKHFLVTAMLAVIASFAAGAAWAEKTPVSGALDARVRFADYHAGQVYKVHTQYGISTDLVFGADVANVAMGDSQAWSVSPVANHLFVKPSADQAETNMTVITDDGRTYNFWLATRSGDASTAKSMFQVVFRYPEDEAREARRQAEIERRKAEAEYIEEQLDDAGNQAANWSYYVKGSREIAPARAYDDGKMTYLTFTRLQEMPAVYVETANGEALVNTHVEDNTLVVHTVSDKLVLRLGREVACIFNKGDTPNTNALPDSRTMTPEVQRTIRSNP